MTEMPELTRCPDCNGWYDTDDMTEGRCPNCAGPEPVDPWEGKIVSLEGAARMADHAVTALAERDQARRFAVAWQGEAEAYREVVKALTHSFVSPPSDIGRRFGSRGCHSMEHGDEHGPCLLMPDDPVHRTIAVIHPTLMPGGTSMSGVIPNMIGG